MGYYIGHLAKQKAKLEPNLTSQSRLTRGKILPGY
jgi:hypothetical protein